MSSANKNVMYMSVADWQGIKSEMLTRLKMMSDQSFNDLDYKKIRFSS